MPRHARNPQYILRQDKGESWANTSSSPIFLSLVILSFCCREAETEGKHGNERNQEDVQGIPKRILSRKWWENVHVIRAPLRSALTAQHSHIPQFPLPTTLDSRLTINLVCTEIIKRLGERLFFDSTHSPQIFLSWLMGKQNLISLTFRCGSCANLSKNGRMLCCCYNNGAILVKEPLT